MDPITGMAIMGGASALGGALGNLIGGGAESAARKAALRLLQQNRVSGDLEKLYANLQENPELAAAIAGGTPALAAAARGVESPEEQAARAQMEAQVGQQMRGAQEASKQYAQRTGARSAGQALALGRMGELQAGTGAMQAGLQRLAQRGQAQREAMNTASGLSSAGLNRQLGIKNAQASALQQRWNEANAMADARRGVGAGQRQAGANLGAGIGSALGAGAAYFLGGQSPAGDTGGPGGGINLQPGLDQIRRGETPQLQLSGKW